MSDSKKILVDFEKIKDPFSGLGQVCLHLKKYFDQSDLNLSYWMPKGIKKLAKNLPCLIPSSDVFHALHQDGPYMPSNKDTKYILTVHDLNALYTRMGTPKEAKYRKIIQKRLDRASIVCFISHFAKDETLKHFELEEKKTKVIYNGISLGESVSRPKNIPQKPFLFSVGTVMPKKNFHVLIDLIKLLPDYQIVVAGTTYHQYAKDMQKRIESEGLQDRFFLVGTIDEAEKVWYYQNAKAFIFPSLLEGFGLPIAEAMSFGLPLFLSTKTSVPEIGGPNAYYFENFEAKYMHDVFTKGMAEFSEEKRARLIQRSKLFDWKKAADEYLEIYRTI